MVLRLAVATLLVFGMSSCGTHKVDVNRSVHANSTNKPSMDEVEFVEQMIVMPVGAKALSKYDRYYATEMIDNERYIRGKFIVANSVPKIFIVDIGQFPATFDGGCGVLLLRYSLSQRKFDFIRCRGVG